MKRDFIEYVDKRVIDLSVILNEHRIMVFVHGGFVREYISGTNNSTTKLDYMIFEKLSLLTEIIAKHAISFKVIDEYTIMINGITYDLPMKYGKRNYLFIRDLKQECKERDLTMNSMLVRIQNLKTTLFDYADGRTSISNNLLSTQNNCKELDGKTILRIIRFKCLSYTKNNLEGNLKTELINKSDLVLDLDPKIIEEEFTKAIVVCDIKEYLMFIQRLGLLKKICEPLYKCIGISHCDKLLISHLSESCNNIKKNDLNLKIASLFHDIGKSIKKEEHEECGIEIVKKLFGENTNPNINIDKIVEIIKHHQLKLGEDKDYYFNIKESLKTSSIFDLLRIRIAELKTYDTSFISKKQDMKKMIKLIRNSNKKMHQAKSPRKRRAKKNDK